MFLDGGRRILDRETSKPQNILFTLKRFAQYFAKYWFLLLIVSFLVLGSSWAQVTAPVYIGQAVDCYLFPQQASAECFVAPDADPAAPADEKLAGLLTIVLTLVVLFLIEGAFTGLSFFTMRLAAQNVLRTMRQDLFRQVQRLSMGYYSKNEAGEVMSRITNDTDALQQTFNFALLNVIRAVVTIVWIVIRMLETNLPYALLSLMVIPIMLVMTNYFSKQARLAYRRARRSLGAVNAELQENISGAREVQAFNREDETIAQFDASNMANRNANIRAALFTSALGPVLEALGYIGLAVIVVVGGLSALRNEPLLGTAVISLGTVFAFINYIQRINQPIQQLAILWTNVQSGIAGGERIFALLDVDPDIKDKAGASELPPMKGHIVLEDVRAEYKPGELVLKGVDLEVEPGQMVAIVGPTGAGKTTLINLIPRFYDVTGGRVLVDGHDVRDVTMDSLRNQIGIVLQDTFLFSMSVMDNIRYGRLDASDEEVIEAAKRVAAHDFIERLPDGYNTVLGERGGGLSQGQRQLIAIARVALMNPRLLILDEATSSVDTRTERIIQAAFEKLLAGRTSFVIAHRLSTIRNADVVLMLKDGEIIERGTHRELLARGGAYHDLYMSQFEIEESDSAGSNGTLKPQPAGD